ncbi:hypothetical protein POM88_028329 [Heracleum sosnowskyi]|uniref:Serine-threonine/tyrosine-protein kinase catalytic domain-containing protein n=1 Tax=Heracleum sosnowskyi TaxID=360622 RepID=A0AAD8MM72_9APIA|nr:hypothetical protein POM88_028329 [Heracleum sosnowskyi]
MEETSHISVFKIQTSTSKVLHVNFSRRDQQVGTGIIRQRPDLELSGNVRETISLSRTAPLGAPPLCSKCRHRTPAFGKPPRWFSLAELDLATRGFSQANFLAEREVLSCCQHRNIVMLIGFCIEDGRGY